MLFHDSPANQKSYDFWLLNPWTNELCYYVLNAEGFKFSFATEPLTWLEALQFTAPFALESEGTS